MPETTCSVPKLDMSKHSIMCGRTGRLRLFCKSTSALSTSKVDSRFFSANCKSANLSARLGIVNETGASLFAERNSSKATFSSAPCQQGLLSKISRGIWFVSYTHLRAHETRHDLVCRLLLEKKK